MTAGIRRLGLGTLVLAASCTPSDRRWQEPAVPVVRIAATIATLDLASVRSIIAPQVSFDAVVQPDLRHAMPIMAPATGTLRRIRGAGPVRRGDLLAIVSESGSSAGRRVQASQDGTWSPRRLATHSVALAETLGDLTGQGLWIAVGDLGESDASAMHPGDAARLTFGGNARTNRPGRVEWVQTTSSFSTTVGVEFRADDGCLDCLPPVTVVVTPMGAADSALCVPASAVVELSYGSAVFVPSRPGVVQVRWVSTGPRVDSVIIIRAGLGRYTRVVARGVAPLVAAAADSLARKR